MPGTFGHFRSDQAHAQGEAQSSKSFLALWNRPKLVLQTVGKVAIGLQALDRKLNVPGTFGHFRPDQAHAQGEAVSCKSFLALWNRPKLVLQTLGNLGIGLQALDPKLTVPGTFGGFRSDQAHALGEAQSSKSFLALWNRPKLVLQTLGKLAIHLQALDRKLNVPGTFGHFSSDQAHAQGEVESSKCFIGTLESTQTSSADSGQAGDSFVSVRSKTKCAWNFRALEVRPGACVGGGREF